MLGGEVVGREQESQTLLQRTPPSRYGRSTTKPPGPGSVLPVCAERIGVVGKQVRQQQCVQPPGKANDLLVRTDLRGQEATVATTSYCTFIGGRTSGSSATEFPVIGEQELEPSGLRRAAAGSGNAQVVVFGGEALLVCGQVSGADRDDEAPMSADRAVLPAHDTEIDRLQLDAWDPQRGEQMTAPAAHDDVAAQRVAEPTGDHRRHDGRTKNQDR